MKLKRGIKFVSVRGVFGNERGLILIVALVLLVTLTLVGTTAHVITSTDIKIGGNYNTSTTALYLAEAGAEYARNALRENMDLDADTVNDQIQVFTNNQPVNWGSSAVLAGLQAGSSGTVNIVRDPANANSAIITSSATFHSARQTIILVVSKSGFSPSKAITFGESAESSGNPHILGACGSVHSNKDLNISGDIYIDVGVTATGNIEGEDKVHGATQEGVAQEQIPTINPADFKSYADYQLRSNGRVYDALGAQIADANSNPWNGWNYSSGKWDLSEGQTINGMLYIEGDAVVSGNPGETGPPWQTTLLATGNIELSGNPGIANYKDSLDPVGVQNLLLVAGKDLKINGNANQTYEGIIAVREQFYISGNPTIVGAIIVNGSGSQSGLISENKLSGNFNLTYECGLATPWLGGGSLKRTSWRLVL